MTALLLIVRTALRRYAVLRSDITEVRLLAGPDDLQGGDRPYVRVELGPLLDPADRSAQLRRQALVVPLRRRNIALLVDRVEEFLERPAVHPLPALLRERLRDPWATGALLLDGDIVIQLDLRAVARSALLNMPAQGGAKGCSPAA
ncbi:MAG TPA: chemotaxis protein CheW [Roseiflexaceae bacterium]|nr:chemotaxis protein CheW [Roseiflexaceae bacterium]